MQFPPLRSSPRVGVRIGSHVHPAVAVHLDGQAAHLRLDRIPHEGSSASVRLAWPDGRVTELDVLVQSAGAAGEPTEMAICRVQGDWGAFVSYLGRAHA